MIDYSGVRKNTRFFTGVDQLMTGIASLFSPIFSRREIANKIKVATALLELDDRLIWQVTIVHVASHPEQEFSTALFNHGDMGTAKAKFTSLCDWHVVAKCSNGTYSFPVLSASQKAEIIQQDEVEGFTHKLIFY